MEKVGKTPKRKECSKIEWFRLSNLIFQYSEKQVYITCHDNPDNLIHYLIASTVEFLKALVTVTPISAGDSTTYIPHSRIIFIFAAAVSFFPPMIAPA